jgi:GTP-binding protein HflX
MKAFAALRLGSARAPALAANRIRETGIQKVTKLHDTAPRQERAFLVAIDPRRDSGWTAEESLDELAQLAETAGAEVTGSSIQHINAPNPSTYVGKGKLAEIVSERAELGYDTLILDDELSPSQQRHLEDSTGIKVIDRTALILDIFARRAQTREGRLQVELAQLEYLLPRLAGQWSHLERLGGGIGTRGPGESQLETDRRLIRGRIGHLKQQIERVRQHRSLYRRNRARQGLSTIALVGYTNAGKSTLMNALSGSDVRAEDNLFATLDPVTRRIAITTGEPVLLTDTVGFIQKLPTQLIAAFRATLEELNDADLLLHVIDVTHPAAEEQRQTVESTLADLGLMDRPRLELLNKVDLLTTPDRRYVSGLEALRDLEANLEVDHPGAMLISASRRWGLERLREQIHAHLGRDHTPANFRQSPGR